MRALRQGLAVFFAMAALDIVYALYVIYTAGREALPAGALAAVLILISGYVTRAYVDDKRMLIPAGVGAFVGTWLAITFI